MVEASFSPELEQMRGVIREFARDRLAPRICSSSGENDASTISFPSPVR